MIFILKRILLHFAVVVVVVVVIIINIMSKHVSSHVKFNLKLIKKNWIRLHTNLETEKKRVKLIFFPINPSIKQSTRNKQLYVRKKERDRYKQSI